MMANLRLDKVTKRFGTHVAVNDLSLNVEHGEFFVLLGPTGAGKTTTLRLIAGLEKPDSGTIAIGGQDVREWSAAERDVALVFQYYSLYPRYTVRQNLEFPLRSKARRLNQQEMDARVARAAKTLRIEHLLERKTDKLSGGEMQRVSIGRAIVREPRAFLMDEPLSNLDAKLRESLRAELKDLQMKLGATFVFVTHDQIEAMSMGDKVAILNGGHIIQVAPPAEIYSNPRDVFVAGFVGSPTMNLLLGEVNNGQVMALSGNIALPLPDEFKDAANGPVTVGIRAEDVRIGPSEAVEARVHDVENHGVEKVVTLRAGDHVFKGTVPGTVNIAIEDTVRFSWNPAKVRLFNAASGVSLSWRGQSDTATPASRPEEVRRASGM
jgi:multiple sugar transport system ATP-binding protein